MWRSEQEKLKKLIESIAQEKGKRRLKLLQRLEKIAAEEKSMPTEAAQVLLSCVTDPEEEVWTSAKKVIEVISEHDPKVLKGAMGTLVPHVKVPGQTRKRALGVLRTIAQARKGLVDEYRSVLMKELTTGDKEEQDLMLEVLMRVGINAKEYVRRLISIEQVLAEASNSGADISEAEKVLEDAKGQMVAKGINEFLMRSKKAELLARYAKKVSVKWRDFVEDVRRIAISPTGRFIAVGSGNEVLMYTRTKEVQWRFTVEGQVTGIEFSSDARAIVIGTNERMLYLVNHDGEIIWKRRRGGAVTDTLITSGSDDIFVCSDDNNISVLNMDGVELSRQWTDKPVKRIDTTEDGKDLVLTYGDHNIFAYDNRLFLKWKYMGGVWIDVAISRDGSHIIGGSHGGDGVLLSKAGLPIWKKTLLKPIRAVCLRPKSDVFLFATEDGLICYGRSGKVLWSFKTREPVVTFDASVDGEMIMLGTDKGIYMLENREVFKSFLSDLESSLRTMERFGIDISGVGALIGNARNAFEANDYKKGAKFVNEIKEVMEGAKLERGSELLVLAEKKLSDAKEHGVDVQEGETILHRAEDLINRGDFDGAILEARRAVDYARRAETVKKEVEIAEKEKRKLEMRTVIDVAVKSIDEAEALGIDTTEAEEQLQAAITASDEGEFDQCLVMVKDLDELIQSKKRSVPGHTEANYAMAIAVMENDEASEKELEKAVADMNRAVRYYESRQSLARAAECHEIIARLERRRGNLLMSRTHYQKAINTYFKIGELEKVAIIIMSMMKELKGDEELPIYEVEDAFLMFKDGRLIAHHTMRLRPHMDREILGGMLVAIQNFVEDSFRATGAEQLNELRYGKTKILIHRGNFLTFALVITGTETKVLWNRMRETVDEIEHKYVKRLQQWDGDLDKLWGVKKRFEQHLSQL